MQARGQRPDLPLFDAIGALTLGPARIELPDLATLDPLALGIAVLATVLLLRLKWSVLHTRGICAAVDVASAAGRCAQGIAVVITPLREGHRRVGGGIAMGPHDICADRTPPTPGCLNDNGRGIR